jgi:hypothetical protein
MRKERAFGADATSSSLLCCGDMKKGEQSFEALF